MRTDDYFISDEADDLDEAIRIAIRKQRRSRSRAFLLCTYAPPGWVESVRKAPPGRIRAAYEALDAADEMRREDEESRARIVALLLNLLNRDELRGAVVIAALMLAAPASSVPIRAASLYLAEHDVGEATDA